MKALTLSTLLVAATMPATVLADADCPANPKEQWLSEFDMQKKIINDYGFVIHKFKVSGECYEIYGTAPLDADNPKERTKIEVYFNSATGEIVKKRP